MADNTQRRMRRRIARGKSERGELVAEIIFAVARQQIEQPRVSESVRAEQLSKALRAQNIAAEARHAEALVAERNRLISLEVAQLLRKFQEQEDEALLMILAETV